MERVQDMAKRLRELEHSTKESNRFSQFGRQLSHVRNTLCICSAVCLRQWRTMASPSAWDGAPPCTEERVENSDIALLPMCVACKKYCSRDFFCHNCPSCTNKRDWSVCVDCRVWSSFLRHLSDLNDARFCLHRVFKLNSELLEFSWATFCMPPKLPLCSKSWEYHS